MTQVQFHKAQSGAQLAYRLHRGEGPAIVFLPGYMSDMSGSKATMLFDWARASHRACLLFDYSGCGQSEGRFEDGTLSRWRDEALELIEMAQFESVVLVGSSMGGWLMVMIGERLGARLAAMVGIAAAPDFTDWGRSKEDKARLEAGETVFDPNPYGPEPTPMHPDFFRDGQDHLCLNRPIAISCRAHLLHGQRDEDVPWEISLKLMDALASDAVKLTLVKEAGHRLSRESDLALLRRSVEDLIE